MRLEDLAPIAITLIIVGVALGIGANITTQTDSSLRTATTVTNQSVTFTNFTLHPLTNAEVTSIISVGNQTMNYGSGNYTLIATRQSSVLNITIICAASSCTGVGATLNVSYVVNAKNSASLAAGNSTGALGQVGSWIPTIGLIIAAAVIIGILFTSFYGRRPE